MSAPNYTPTADEDASSAQPAISRRLLLAILAVFLGAVLLGGGGLYWKRASSQSREVQTSFGIFQAKVTRFSIAAKDLRTAFVHGKHELVAPSKETDRDLTEAIHRYDPIYQDLESNRADVDRLTEHLSARPELQARARGLVSHALLKVHQGGVLKLNNIHQLMMETRDLKASGRLTDDKAAEKLVAAQKQLDDAVEEIDKQISILEKDLAALRGEIVRP